MDKDQEDAQTGSIREVARNLMVLLNAHVQAEGPQQRPTVPQRTTSPPQQTIPRSTINQDMSRSFPGLFSRNSARGRKRVFSPSRVVTSTNGKSVTVTFFLLHQNTDKTPKASTELTLILAGMGKRAVTFPESADHTEISRLLTTHYPKLERLTGGWLLYKAPGGSGQRKLSLIPPEAEGYNGSLLKNVTGGGKNMIYVIPLQEELDTSPLPPDALEFQSMPKAPCKVCSATMPLHVLAVHVKSCVDLISSGDDFETSNEFSPLETHAGGGTPVMFTSTADDANFPGTPTSNDDCLPGTSDRTDLAACPICQQKYNLDFLQIHASYCGDSHEENAPRPEDTPESLGCGVKNLADVMTEITNAVSKDDISFEITVSRHNMLERGIVQWQRQKRTSPTNQLKVTFIGEAGVDTGALRKEFLTEMIAGIEKRFFLPGKHGCMPKYSLSDLDKGYFRTVGEIMAASVAQGGPSPNFMMPWCYKVLCSGSPDFEGMGENDVSDDHFSDLLSKVQSANDTTLQDIMEEILNCGYTGMISLDKKEEIMRSVILHANLRVLPILQQIREGLRLYGLSDMMERYQDICQPLFVPGVEMKADADFIISVCHADFSEKGSNKEQSEVTLMNHLQDFLQELEEESSLSAEKGTPVYPRAFLQWITGQAHVPVLQEERRNFTIIIKFLHECESTFGPHKICYPSVAACSNTITFPVQHMRTYEEFKYVLMEAFNMGQEFSRI